MSFPYTPNLQDARIESLRTQYDYLNLLRLRHLHWTQSSNNPRVQSVHREIAGLIQQITDRYDELLNINKGR